MKKIIFTQDFRTGIENIKQIKEATQILQINLMCKENCFYHYHPMHCDCPHYMPCSLPNFLCYPLSRNQFTKQLQQLTIRFHGDFNIVKWLDNNYDQDSPKADGINIFENSWTQLAKHLALLNSFEKLTIITSGNIIDTSNEWWSPLKNKIVQVLSEKNWDNNFQCCKKEHSQGFVAGAPCQLI